MLLKAWKDVRRIYSPDSLSTMPTMGLLHLNSITWVRPLFKHQRGLGYYTNEHSIATTSEQYRYTISFEVLTIQPLRTAIQRGMVF